jgi:signal transduction histidine kinase/ligand-binding sensor domain-containing protein
MKRGWQCTGRVGTAAKIGPFRTKIARRRSIINGDSRHNRMCPIQLPRRVLIVVSLFCTAVVICTPAWALDRSRAIRQFHHTAWTAREGAPTEIVALAQTADGFLWLGTGNGLFRFDGVRFERFAPDGSPPNTTSVSALLGTPAGELFVGYRHGGVSILKAGRIENFTANEGLPIGAVYRFVQDRDGVVWVATLAGLARFDGSRWALVDLNGPTARPQSFNAVVDVRGNLWADNGTSLLVKARGAAEFTDTGVAVNRGVFAVSPTGVGWLEDGVGVVRLLDGTGKTTRVLAPWTFSANQQGMIFDRDSGLWVATTGRGVQRVADTAGSDAPPTTRWRVAPETFTHNDGLTSDFATSVFEDREGNVWVGTRAGLDRFRDSRLVPIVIPDGAVQLALAPGENGSMFIGSYNRPLMRVDGSSVVAQRISSRITCAYRDPSGALWLGGPQLLLHRQGNTFARIALPAAAKDGDVQAMVMDRDGGLWLSIVRAGLFRWSGDAWTQEREPPNSSEFNPLVATSDATATWFGYPNSTIVRIGAGTRRVFSGEDGVRVGDVTALLARDDHLWIGGTDGLADFDGAGFHLIDAVGYDLRGVSGIIETREGDLWISGGFGIVRIAAPEVRRALGSAHAIAHLDQFDFADGLPGRPQQFRPLPSAVEGSDGRLWFSTIDGVVWVDPRHLSTNPLAPPVVIRAVDAHGARYAPQSRLQFPIGTRDLTIDCTALSLSVPERVRFRFQLEGVDPDWQEAGGRRQAFYTNLRPGSYRFHVIAANDDGVWNETGAWLDFSIAPAYYETAWFRTGVVVAALAVLWAVYQRRLRRLAAEFDARLQERVNERTRIARELHDTLLQSFLGVRFRFQAARNLLPHRPADAIPALDRALDQAGQALREGREAIQGLRSSTLVQNSMADAIAVLGAELASRDPTSTTSLNIDVEGRAREIHPVVRDEVYRITAEALRNAFGHAQARRIDVNIRYDDSMFRVLITDDGIGIDPERFERHTEGHWGLPGMRERAELLGGTLRLSSKSGAGTRVELTVPARHAYASTSNTRRFWRRRTPQSVA